VNVIRHAADFDQLALLLADQGTDVLVESFPSVRLNLSPPVLCAVDDVEEKVRECTGHGSCSLPPLRGFRRCWFDYLGLASEALCFRRSAAEFCTAGDLLLLSVLRQSYSVPGNKLIKIHNDPRHRNHCVDLGFFVRWRVLTALALF
jgi:hypothetical protein